MSTRYAIRTNAGQYFHNRGRLFLASSIQRAKKACRSSKIGRPRSIVRLETNSDGLTYAAGEADFVSVGVYHGKRLFRLLPFEDANKADDKHRKAPTVAQIEQARRGQTFEDVKRQAKTILREVAAFYGITPEDITGPRRTERIAKARAVAMNIVQRVLTLGDREVAEIVNRDRTNVVNRRGMILRLEAKDPAFAQHLKTLEEDVREAIRGEQLQEHPTKPTPAALVLA